MGHPGGVSDHDDRAAERALLLIGAAAWLFARGHAADLILIVMLAEALWLTRARGWPIGDTAVRLLPGACLVVALRLALTGADWPWIALALAASFPPHLADLMRHAPHRPAEGEEVSSPSDRR